MFESQDHCLNSHTPVSASQDHSDTFTIPKSKGQHHSANPAVTVSVSEIPNYMWYVKPTLDELNKLLKFPTDQSETTKFSGQNEYFRLHLDGSCLQRL